MSAKKGRGAKVSKVPQHANQNDPPMDDEESPNLSVIERASFLEGLQLNYGNPLHSTAMEEDLNVLQEGRLNKGKAGRKDVPPQTLKTNVKQRGAAVKRKETELDEDNEKESEEEEEKKKRRKSAGGKAKARPEKGGETKKKKGAPEDVERKESGPKGSASAGAEKGDGDKQRRKKRVGGQGGTELEVALDAFLDFCEQYRESVETKAVRHSIDSFSSSVKEQLLEKISSHKELKVLKRENAKVASLIRTKTQRLLDAKHELMRAERQTWSLQKEKSELTDRLADLIRGRALLHDIGELNRQYLAFRHKHPTEKETYGASSLPALLLQTEHIRTAEDQLRGINNQLEHRVKTTGTDE